MRMEHNPHPMIFTMTPTAAAAAVVAAAVAAAVAATVAPTCGKGLHLQSDVN